LSPLLQLQLVRQFGPDGPRQEEQRRVRSSEHMRDIVNNERAQAVARGVHVVVDETRPAHYTLVKVWQEEETQ
jgi:hypothetical protein